MRRLLQKEESSLKALSLKRKATTQTAVAFALFGKNSEKLYQDLPVCAIINNIWFILS
jgi:hypothetical protein